MVGPIILCMSPQNSEASSQSTPHTTVVSLAVFGKSTYISIGLALLFLVCIIYQFHLFGSLTYAGTGSASAFSVPVVKPLPEMPNLGVVCKLTYEQYSALMGLLMSDGGRFAPVMVNYMYPDQVRIVFSGLSMDYVV